MFRIWLTVLLTLAATAQGADKTALHLMLDGRYSDARRIIDGSNLSPRYSLLFYALTEGDAARACSLYQVVAIRYPKSDCDSVARGRLQQALEMGVFVQPITEWKESDVALPPFLVNLAPPVSSITAPEPIAAAEAILEPAPIAEPEPIAAAAAEAPPAEAEIPAAESAPVHAGVHDVTAPPELPKPAAEIIGTAADVSPDVEPVTTPEPIPAPDTVVTRVKKVDPPVADVPHDKPLAGNGDWYIQVGAFGNHANAHRLADALRKAGYPVKLVPRETAAGAKLLQVRVGGYASREECDSLKAALKDQFDVPTVVISE